MEGDVQKFKNVLEENEVSIDALVTLNFEDIDKYIK